MYIAKVVRTTVDKYNEHALTNRHLQYGLARCTIINVLTNNNYATNTISDNEIASMKMYIVSSIVIITYIL